MESSRVIKNPSPSSLLAMLGDQPTLLTVGGNSVVYPKVGLKRGDAVAIERARDSWSVIGTFLGVRILTVSAVRTHEFSGGEEVFRTCLMRNHIHPGIIKHVTLKADDIKGLLRRLALVVIESLDTQMAELLSKLGLFCVRPGEDFTKNFTEKIPIAILCLMDRDPIKAVQLESYIETYTFSFFDRRKRFTEQSGLSKEDRDKYDAQGDDLGMSTPIQNLEGWAHMWFPENERAVIKFDEASSWDDESFGRALLNYEIYQPGTAVILASKTGLKWPMKFVMDLTQKRREGPGENWFQYRCFVNSYQRALFEAIDYNQKASEYSCPNYSTTILEDRTVNAAPIVTMKDADDIAKDATIARLTRLNSVLMADKNKLVTENSNLTHTSLLHLRHNHELQALLEDTLLAEDDERKDGARRKLRYESKIELDDESQRLECQANHLAKETKRKILPMAKTTTDQREDLRLKLIAKRALSEASVIPLPLDHSKPDIDDSNIFADNDDTPSLRDERIKAVRGVLTSSSSSSDSDDKGDLRERLRQIRSKARKENENGADVVVLDVIDTSKPGVMGLSLRKMYINREEEAKKRAEMMEVESSDGSVYSPSDCRSYPKHPHEESACLTPNYSPGDSANWGSVVKDWEKVPTSSMIQSPDASQLSAQELQRSIEKILDSTSSSGSSDSKADSESPDTFKKPRPQLDSVPEEEANNSVEILEEGMIEAEPEKDKKRCASTDTSVIEVENPDISVKVLSHKKTSHHQDPTSPCTLEMSALRIENSADDSMVSEGNLSDVQNIEEYDFNKSRPAEKILDQLAETGNPHELSLEDKDLEKLLDGDSDTSLPLASTPTSSPRRSASTSPPSSMPSLVYSTSSVNDSGNSSQDHANAEINSDESPSGAEDVSQLTSDQTPNQDAESHATE